MDWLSDPQAWIALLTLTLLEVVLGIDNVIFISILAGKLPDEKQQKKARTIGLLGAMVMRLLLLLSIAWIVRLTAPWFHLFGQDISGRDLILLAGGLFLIGKATHEIHNKLEGPEGEKVMKVVPTLGAVIVQIMLLDAVFSLDSVITAVGMARHLGVMVAAVVISIAIMLVSAGAISAFVNRHPTVKMLALSFLLLIGTALMAEGLEFHIPKGYIYFAMAFSVFVELLNMRFRRVSTPVKLHEGYRKPVES
ncbi:MAG TPA: TerC family protein [Thermoanaerobaculia bacterium]|nr:TerC family protein [Thermoanaerobaculia bacterium]